MTRILRHRCDNPLWQRNGPGHVVVSAVVQNRREWASRRRLSGNPLNPRGPRRRARVLHDRSGLAGAVVNTPPVDKPDLGRRAKSDVVPLACAQR